MSRHIYPVSIVRARYGGAYEPAPWLAFNKFENQLPFGWNGDDTTCACFWDANHEPVGAGNTPDEAYHDLIEKLGAA